MAPGGLANRSVQEVLGWRRIGVQFHHYITKLREPISSYPLLFWSIRSSTWRNFPHGCANEGGKVSNVDTNGARQRGFTGIIKHRETEKYYIGEGRWAVAEDDAMKFTSIHEVADEARKYNIKDCCEFILRLVGRPGMVVMLPL